MNSKIGLLSGLALVQLVLAAVAVLAPTAVTEEVEPLLAVTAEEVTALLVADAENEVEVVKTDEGWQVGGVPADADKVSNMLDKLGNLSAPWPVATSRSSAERFEVSEENFQRRVRLRGGDATLGDVYLGTSPSYQRVHARRADSDDVFSVALSNYELGVNVDTWLDKGLLASADAPTRITVDFAGEEEAREEVLDLGEEGWLYNGAAADQDAARTYANRFTTLRVLGLADAAAESEDDAEAETKRLAQISFVDGEQTRTVTVSKAGEDDYLIAGDSGSQKYRIATYIAEQLLMTDADFSVKEEETASAEGDIGES